MAFRLFASKINKEENKEKKPKKKKSVLREWIDAIVFAVIAATIIRWAFFSAYTIPTSSMEGTQLVGDFLFVSKISYGPRTPKTILRIPLTDNKIWGTNIPSYLSWIQLPIGRFPGYKSVANGNVVVFNYPMDEMPVDMKTHYIKRCVGIAGDKIEIKKGKVFINDKVFEDAPNVQHSYLVKSKEGINERIFEKLDIKLDEIMSDANGKDYEIKTTQQKADALKEFDFIKSVEKNIETEGKWVESTFPNHEAFKWNVDNFGPLVIPKAGMKIQVNKENLILYKRVIEVYEWNKDVKIEGDKLKIDGKEIKEYTFKQDYYFMMGDNRHNSQDSRFWGFVPKDHIVGEATLTWLSLDYNKSLFNGKIRWGRMFRFIY